MEDYFENSRDMLAKSERQIVEARRKREDLQRAEDKRVREGLEKMSASSGQRLSLADMLNRMSVTRMETNGVDAITKIREQQDLGRRTPAQHNREYDKFEKAGGVENFNRLHPSSELRGARPLARSMVPMDSGGATTGEPRLNPERRPGPRGNFDFRADDPGNLRGRYFEPAEGSAQGSAGRVPDASGRVRGDNEGGRHFASGEVEAITADLQWLLSATRALIATINDPRYARSKV